MKSIELEVMRTKQERPTITPAGSFKDAAIGAYHAFTAKAVRVVRIVEKVQTEKGVKINPLLTVTRYGEQEFANGKAPWWETHK